METQKRKALIPQWIKNLMGTKTIIRAALIILATPAVMLWRLNETTKVIDSHIWALAGLVLLVTGMTKIAAKRAGGWLCLGYFFFASAFGQVGITAWVYIIIAGSLAWVWLRWNKPDSEDKKAPETD